MLGKRQSSGFKLSVIASKKGLTTLENLPNRTLTPTFNSAFPDYHDAPAVVHERFDGVRVSCFGFVDFVQPKVLSCGWDFEEMAVMAVPAAPVDEDHHSVFRENQIG